MRVIEKKGLPCLLPEQRGTMPGHMPQIPAKSGIRHPGRILSRGIGTPRTVLALPPSYRQQGQSLWEILPILR